MGLKALIDYSLIKELCDHLKTTNNKFTGRLKIRKSDHEPPSKKEKLDELKFLLQRAKRQTKKRRKTEKVPKTSKKPTASKGTVNPSFDYSSEGSSVTGSSSENRSSSSESGDSDDSEEKTKSDV